MRKQRKKKIKKVVSEDIAKKGYEELLEEKKSIENLLSSLEDDYREANISEEVYHELREKNLKRLNEVERLLKEREKEKGEGEVPEIKPVLPKPEISEEKIKKIVSEEISAQVKKLSGEIAVFNITLENYKMELEKIKTLIDTLKEGKAASDERLHLTGEQLAELRTFFRQMDMRVSEWETKLEKFSDMVAGLELKRIKREFDKINRNFGEHAMRIEKVEAILPPLREKVLKVEKTLKDIGSIENLITVMKEIDSKLKEIREISDRVGRTAEKTEKAYVELHKMLLEFEAYKDKVDKTADLVKEIMRGVDELNSKLANYAKTEDLNAAKEMLERRIESIRSDVVELIPEPIKELRKESETIKGLLTELEKKYEEGVISEKEYKVAKEKNEKRLAEIELKMAKIWEEIKGVKKTKEPIKKREEKKVDLIAELDDLFKKGWISKEAYERSKRILMSE